MHAKIKTPDCLRAFSREDRRILSGAYGKPARVPVFGLFCDCEEEPHYYTWGKPGSNAPCFEMECPRETVDLTEQFEGPDGIQLPRYAWHRPPWDYDTSQGLRAYQPASTAEMSGEADAIRRWFGADWVEEQGILWLAPAYPYPNARWTWKSFSRRGRLVDLAALRLDNLRYTYGAEGYVLHLGDIPAEALVDVEKSEKSVQLFSIPE